MLEPFIDCTTLDGQRRIRGYVQSWLERLDYAGKLDRGWPARDLAERIWARVQRDFASAWAGPLVLNEPLTCVIASTMVEDYLDAYPERRATRYAVSGPLPDCDFRRCVLDFVHDLEEFEPAELPEAAERAAAAFWTAVEEHPEHWGYTPARGPLLDDPARARLVAQEAIRGYFQMRCRVEHQRRVAGE